MPEESDSPSPRIGAAGPVLYDRDVRPLPRLSSLSFLLAYLALVLVTPPLDPYEEYPADQAAFRRFIRERNDDVVAKAPER